MLVPRHFFAALNMASPIFILTMPCCAFGLR